MMWTYILLIVLVSCPLVNADLSTLNRDCHSIYDAVLVVDGSESIGLENFKTIKRALMEFVNNTLQPNKDVHLGAVLYSSGVEETVNLTSDWAMLDDKINAMAWPARATFTDSGIEAATAMLLEQGRKVVPRILIVVTDGLSSRPDRTLVAAAAAKQSSITVYSVGIEVYVKANSEILARYKTELSTIASDEGHVIHLADFNEFENIAPELATKFCAVIADIVTGLQNLTVYVGDTFTLTAEMSHAAVVGGTWTLNGVPLSDGGRVNISNNGSLQHLTLNGAALTDAGEYAFTVGTTTAQGYVSVDATTITQGLTDQTVSQGTQVVFQVTLSQTGITGDWFKDGVSITGDSRYQTQSAGNTQYMFFTNSQVSDSGTYTFTANGQSTSARLTVTGSGAVNGNWGEWTQWSGPTCPATCGSAAINNLSRSRSCDNPAPSNGGTSCTGEASQSESRMCGPSTCDSTITGGLTDQTVSQGTQVVFQVTLSQTGITGDWFKDGVNITGDSRFQTQSSGNTQYMFFTNSQVSDSGTYTFTANGQSTSAQLTVTGSGAVNGNWGEWTQWSGPTCPATCGSAAINNLSRSRSCDNPAPSNGGTSCTGEASQSESRMCGPSTCDSTITGGLTDQTVSQGTQVVFQVTLSQTGITGDWFKDGVNITGDSRFQTQSSGNTQYMFFTNSQVSDSGTYTFTANGQSTSAQLTVTGSGAVNGNWGEWTQWSGPTCPATCGSAAVNNLSRSRSCDNPAPSNGGTSCTGEASQSESRMCGPSTCDSTITGGLTDQTVSQGTQVVFQVTLSQTGITGDWFKDGVNITGDSRFQTQSSGNTQYMFFTNSQVSDSGTYTFTANGQSTSAQLTVTGSGAVNGNWGEWTQWSGPTCPATCGSAAVNNLSRSRSCDNPAPSNGGTSCTGEASQSESRMCGPSTCDSTITGGLTDQTVSQGTQVVFQVTLSQTGITGDWFKDGVNITGDSRFQTQSSGNTQYMFFTNSQVSDSGTYTFTANGQSTSAQLTVTGSGAVNGNWGEWTQWSGPTCPATCGSAAVNNLSRSRSCDNPAPSNGGTSCTGEASQSESRMCGPSTCDSTITGGLTDQTVSQGTQVVFQVTLSQTGITGDWFKDGVNITGDSRFQTQSSGNTQYMFFTNSQVSDSGTYTFTANGQSTSAQLTVTGSGAVNGNWGEWTQWSGPTCPATCGSAAINNLSRSRSCDNPAPSNGGTSCTGEASQSESRMCGPSTCDSTITGGLTDQTVSQGTQVVFQVTLSQTGITGDWFKDGVNITGDSRFQTQSSGNTQYMFFTNSQVSDSGTYTFTANGQSTSAQLTVTGSGAVNGNWGEWTQWSGPTCPATCGSAAVNNLSRSRSCDNPAPSNGGTSCTGEASQSESRMCGPSTCDSTITGGLTDQTVSQGTQVVFQVTLSQTGITGDWFKDGVNITGDSRFQTQSSGNTQYMFFTNSQVSDSGTYTFTANGQSTSAQLTVTGSGAVNGNWGEWTQWSGPTCPATCGSAAVNNLSRSRSCDNPAPSNGGTSCTGEASQSESRMCGPSTCDTITITGGLTDQTVSQGTQVVFQVTLSQTGITGDWFKDGVSITGDSRYQTQSSGNIQYMFFNSQVSDSGTYMFTANGQSTSAQLTVTGSDAVNGNWGEWTQWSGPTCPATCGSAAINNLSRSRSCDNPAPSNGGTSCTGEASQSESRMCGPSTCDTTTITQGLTDQTVSQGIQVVFQVTLSQTGITGDWFKDGVSITGDSRYQTQSSGNIQYMYFNSQVSDSGTYMFTANGQSTSAQLTVTGSGAVNGNWGEWTQWSGPTCPATCGSAAINNLSRSRSCDNPAPSNGGTSCTGEASQSESRMCGPSTCDIGFTTELRDTRARLGGDFTLTAVVNRTGLGDGQWTKGGQVLTTNDRMTIGSDGAGTYTLRVRGTETTDQGRYTFSAGGKSTGCRVTVIDCHSIYDAVLVVDGSESIGLENFKTIKRALMEFVNNTLQPNKDVHLGVVLYSSGVEETVNMTSDWAMLDDRINAMAWPARATFTHSGIEAATAMLLEQGRKVVPRILIVVTDGLSTRPDRTLVAAAAAKQSSITVYSVGIEVYVKANSVILARYKTELSTIASDEGHVIHLADFNEFENIAPELATKFCAVVADVVTGPQNLTVYVGDTFTLTAQMSHAAVVGGTWTLNGVPLSDGGRVSFSQNGSLLHLTIQEVTAADAGRYSYSVGGKTAHGYVSVLASWGPWGDWVSSACTATCGLSVTQTLRRARQCRQATGPTCVGDATDEDVRACSVTNCYGMWSDWGKWSTPSCPICGQSGTQVQVYRTRTCIKERATDEACTGSTYVSSGYACTLNQCTGNQNPSASDRVRGTFLVIAAGVAVGLTLL
ncbi:obscurin-like isoform X2 [Haliotis rufescens]|uniref:obscurin-like isoform X2 n=1 Tax=Haliotis rufescens TaxID=6454 RepID=UPI00201F8708|nr:obscurin-like isoform X2 [Haliotis rufescens]